MPPDRVPSSPFESILESSESTESPNAASAIAEFVAQLKDTADKLAKDGCSRGDAKMLATAMKELRYCFKVFAEYRGKRKITIFGSARTADTHPAYLAAVEFGKQMAAAGYMVITGAAAGIMEAGHVGAGRDNSFGLNILLPFEQSANPIILDDAKLMNLRYFFTRKLVFIKESDAVALFPGGFGTHDEAFETLTLIQTGKSHIFPLVLIDEPGGDYWRSWQRFVDDALLARGYISPEDVSLYRITDSVQTAVEEVLNFYRVYHSMRFVKGDLVLRLETRLADEVMEQLQDEFEDLIVSGSRFEQSDALPQEANEPSLATLSRLRFRFKRERYGRLRQLIDAINRLG